MPKFRPEYHKLRSECTDAELASSRICGEDRACRVVQGERRECEREEVLALSAEDLWLEHRGYGYASEGMSQ